MLRIYLDIYEKSKKVQSNQRDWVPKLCCIQEQIRRQMELCLPMRTETIV